METRSVLDHPRPFATPSLHKEGGWNNALWFAIFLIVMGAAMRLARHFGVIDLPPNFAPVSAMAMFSAVYLPRRLALVIPLALMLVSDAFIGFDFWPITLSIYVSFLVSSLIGRWLRGRVRWWSIGSASLLSSSFFFVVTNAAVWMFTKMYAPGLGGLLQSYVAGLPFFRNTAIGDLVYSGLFFGLYQAVVLYLHYRQKPAVRLASHD